MSEVTEFRERGIAAVRLLQGVVYADDEDTWAILLDNESDLTDYFCQIGLALVIDRSEGLAYLRQFDDDERTGGYERIPRLFRRSPLGYEATLLCVIFCATSIASSRKRIWITNVASSIWSRYLIYGSRTFRPIPMKSRCENDLVQP